MSQELIYTSAPRGLKLGARGFCTVASTPGMAKNLADRLESLSGYRHLYPPGSPEAHLNPVNFSYLRFTLGGQTYFLLSRIADAGLDYTQRTNKLAHHVVLHPSELPSAGPAWLASQPGFFETTWTRDPELLPNNYRQIPQGRLSADVCTAWKTAAGDAGWAGVLAEHLLNNESDEAYLIYRPGTNVLELFVEAQALLPPDRRWAATFSTYFTKLSPGIDCRWRGVVEGSPEALRARRSPDKLVIDLTVSKSKASGGELVGLARSGRQAAPTTSGIASQSMEISDPTDSPTIISQPARWSAGKLDADGFTSPITPRPPALPRRRSFRSPLAMGQGLSLRERAVWTVIVILLASLIGLTYYFPRPATELPPALVARGNADATDRAPDDPKGSEEKLASIQSVEKAGSPSVPAKKPPTVEGAKDKSEEPAHEPDKSSLKTLGTSEHSGANQIDNDEPPAATAAKNEAQQADAPPVESKKPLSWDDVLATNGFQSVVSLPLVSQSITNDSWKNPITLVSFRNKPEIEPSLVASNSGIGKVTISQSPKQFWKINLNKANGGSEELATIGFDQGNCDLQFRWSDDADKATSGATELVRAAALELRIPGITQTKIISFLPVQESPPFDLAGDILVKGKWTVPLPNDLWIPSGQEITAHLRFVGKDSDKPLSVALDKSNELPLKIPNLKLRIRFIRSNQRPSLYLDLVGIKDEKDFLFPEWYRKLSLERKKQLEDAIMHYERVSGRSPQQAQLTLPTELSELQNMEKEYLNKLKQINPKIQRYDQLEAHEKSYGELTSLREQLKKFFANCKLSVRITRRISITHEIQPIVFVAE